MFSNYLFSPSICYLFLFFMMCEGNTVFDDLNFRMLTRCRFWSEFQLVLLQGLSPELKKPLVFLVLLPNSLPIYLILFFNYLVVIPAVETADVAEDVVPVALL